MMGTMTSKRIQESQIAAANARRAGDRAAYWKARRILLLAQSELAKQKYGQRFYGELPF